MAEADPTCIGRVSHVLGATVTVRLDPDLAGVAPLWRGRLQPIGQVGSLVVVPQGPVRLLASVTLVGISEPSGVAPPADAIQTGDRWLRVQLLGEVDAVGASTAASARTLVSTIPFTSRSPNSSPAFTLRHLRRMCALAALHRTPRCR